MRLLADADPVVRGEAGLIVAAQADPIHHSAILHLARDDDVEARERGILALGLQATPGVTAVLDDLLCDYQTRTQPLGITAAFALGMLPPEHAPAMTSRILTSFLEGSLKRQRDTLLALLLGLRRHEQGSQTTALRRLFDDESLRDPEVRAQLLALLLPVDRTFDAKALRRVLERGSDEERAALLTWLGPNASACDSELVPLLERTALHGSQPEQRALALAVLTRLRHLPALEIAAKALRSSSPIESGQAMRSVLGIGGASMRRALEQRVLDESDPVRKAALLQNYDAPLSTELGDACAHLAADESAPMPLRTAAATLLARSAPERASPILRDLFRATTVDESLGTLAIALLRDAPEPPALSRLLDGPVDLRQHPARWQALVAARHPEAVRQVLACLEAPNTSTADRTQALSIWRRTMLLALPRPRAGSLPAVLQTLLAD
ncbi:MAG TPA: hypothetical protein VFZ65_23260 [Planctomycetota bacterium]|nr:hypothetical protein [Planctomycetota bacterium]